MPIKLTIPLSQIGASQGASDGIIIELTPEQVNDIIQQESQARTLRKGPAPDICQRINSWEDAAKIVEPRFFMDMDGSVKKFPGTLIPANMGENVPTERHAKSMLAFAQLSVIAEAYNKDADGNPKTHTVSTLDGKLHASRCMDSEVQIAFAIPSHRDDCLKKFEQLWKDYWMID